MMIPITRKEQYINEIVGKGKTAPGTPQTREEFFYAAILGEVVAPFPITNIEKYLAKIAGKYNGELPEPITRIEFFIARAAGMNVSAPTPITREEMFWADYAAVAEYAMHGIPPLTFNAVAGTLSNYRIYGNTETKTRSYSGAAPLSFPIADGSVSNYRIYGNTVNGESVGDKTENLFSSRIEQGSFNSITGVPNNLSTRVRSHEDDYIFLTPGVYKISAMGVEQFVVYAYDLPDVNAFNYNLSSTNWAALPSTITINTSAYYKFGFCKTNNPIITPSDISNIMLNTGSTALPYEPYGYKIPITNNSETANIYLDEPISKSGNNADYIDYAEQKRYNADGTSEDVTLPDLPAQSTSNSLSVGTTIQPSSVAVDVSEIVSCGDKVTDSQSVNYGKYKIPVTLTAGSAETTDIYLDTPLAKSGNNADYIDYVTQKRHNSDGTESSVTLPEISTLAGTNTLSVGTTVQPSEVYIKYEGAR